MTRLVPVVLCGGSGTRMWPVSRSTRPKQLLPLTSHRTLLQETCARLDGLGADAPVAVCGPDLRFHVAEQLAAAGVEGASILVEPVGRGTAPAVAAAAHVARVPADDPLLLVLPSDHHVADPAAFRDAVRRGVPHAEAGALVVFGVPPRNAETGFGWIRQGAPLAPGVVRVDAFVEKPDARTAAAFVADGRHRWNAGIFLFRASRWLEELARFAPDLAGAAGAAAAGIASEHGFLRLPPSFAACPADSVDYAVMERTADAVAVDLDAGWSDVGSWAALWEVSPHDEHGNATVGDVLLLRSHGSYVRAGHRLVVGVGLEDLVVVETADAVLVAPRARAQEVREAVARLEAAGREAVDVHTAVERPWGTWEVLDEGGAHRVKRLVVTPGHGLSLQVHARRSEHWVVVRGEARVTLGDRTLVLGPGGSVDVPAGVAHRLENAGTTAVELVEVAFGEVLEHDVVRLDDRYGRAGE